ncbi:cytosolic protein [Bacillus sp. FJAT-47783]|uniref:cytosolic protein n=1 Tax=Bacillus sp. FJAT-47783 TaxID=2922712 RepID=UPI001FAB4BF9|nr:cytosolic protein [Bacillus sp. FJAT-47783]
MKVSQKIQSVFSTQQETREHHEDPQLKSKYYKVNKKSALETIQLILNELDGYHISSISEEHGEISVDIQMKKKAFMVISVVTVRPFETAIDLTVTTETLWPLDFGFSKAIIVELYNRLDEQLPKLEKK